MTPSCSPRRWRLTRDRRQLRAVGYGGLKSGWTCPRPGRPPARRCTASRYGNVGIISLDANELSWEIQGLLDYSHGAQVRWLEEQLPAWRRDPRIDFIVAFYHECAFSTCNGHSSDGGVRSTLAPLFSKYQVDLAVQGHNHVYERTNPLIYDAEDQQRPVQQAGGRPLASASPPRSSRPRTAPPTRGRHRGHAPLRLDRGARDRPQLRGRQGQRHDRRRRRQDAGRGRTSTSATSARPTRPSTGRRPGTPTTASSRSTSPLPRPGSGPR